MKRKALGILGLAALVAACASYPAVNLRAQDAPAAGAQAEPTPTPTPLADQDLIVSINGKKLTVEQLRFLALTRRSPYVARFAANAIPSMRGEELTDLAKSLGVYDALAAEAKEKGVEPTDEDKAKADQQLNQFLEGIVFRMVITDQLKPPTAEELDAAYEARREKEFKRLEELRMRHLYVSTYEEYRAKEGDTLESIAAALGGSDDLAMKILDDATKKPRIESYEAPKDDPEAKSDMPLPPRALTEGELLLVPSKAKIESAKAKAEDAIKRLQAGESFEKVAMEVSENENPGKLWTIRPETQERSMMEELLTAFNELKDGEFSQPIQTKHGFQIVKREGYQAKSYVSREDAEAQLKSIVEGEKRQGLIDAFFEKYGNDPAVVSIKEAAVLARGEDAKPEDVLATIGEKVYVRKDVAEGRSAPTEKDLETVDSFRKWLLGQRSSKQEIVEGFKKSQKLGELDSAKQTRELALATVVATRYLDTLLADKASALSEEEIRKYYDENISYYRQSAAYDLVAVNAAYDPALEPADAKAKAIALLEEKAGSIQTVADFRSLADEMKANAAATGRSGALGMISPDNLPEEDRKAVEAAKVPGKSAIVAGDSLATIYWVDSKREESTEPFDSVKAAITDILGKRVRGDAETAIHVDYKEKAEVEALTK